MIVNPGIRRFLGSAIQRLFNSASFSAPLTHTLVPERGTGSPSFTRATTKTWQNNDGYLVTGVAGEIGFEGARRVRNLVAGSSEDLTNAAWVAISTKNVTANYAANPNGDVLADRVILGSGDGLRFNTGLAAADLRNKTWLVSCYVRSVTGTSTFRFNLAEGGVANRNSADLVATTTWQRFSFSYEFGGSGVSFVCGFLDPVAGGGSDIIVWGAQLEDVTAQTTQTAGEYVSVGVESAPAYHGSMVDGVKCYDTDRSGNPISTSGSYPIVGYVPWEARTNLCLQSNALTTTWTSTLASVTQNAVGPDGGTTAWTLNDTDVGSVGEDWQNITLTAAPYTMSAFVKKTSGATTFPVMYVITGTVLAVVTIDTNNGVATVWTAYTGFTMLASASARCASYNSNYWRVELTYTATAAVYHHAVVAAGTTNATQSTGTLSATVIGSAVFYGVQVELGSFASSYIPTTTIAVARNADVDQYPTTDGPIAAAGSISLDFTPYHAPSGTIALWGTYVDASNYTAILHDATNLIFRKRIAGSNYDATIANAFVSGTTYKVAATWGAAGTAIYLDGVAGTPHANTTAAQIAATMQVGADGNSLQQPGAGTTNLRIWQRQLSSPEGVAVTA